MHVLRKIVHLDIISSESYGGALVGRACWQEAVMALPYHGVGIRGTLNRVCALGLLLVVMALTPLAYASPPDPIWVPGIYDAADYDDVVCLLVDRSIAREYAHAVGVVRPILVGSLTSLPFRVHVPPCPSTLHTRAPPVVPSS
jgi:hypothetical protein